MPRADRTLLSVLLVAALFVLSAGCVSISGADSTTDIRDELASADPPATVTATLETTVELEGEHETYTEPVWLRADGTSRIGDAERGSDYVRVDDGERVWQYAPAAETVSVRDSNETEHGYLGFKYAEQERYLEEYDVTDIEETTVDGHDAYRITFDPPPEETIERSVGIVIGDTEYVLPLETAEANGSETYADHVELVVEQTHQFMLSYRAEADGVELTLEYTDIAFDDDLEGDLFAFEPPESATVEDDSEDGD